MSEDGEDGGGDVGANDAVFCMSVGEKWESVVVIVAVLHQNFGYSDVSSMMEIFRRRIERMVLVTLVTVMSVFASSRRCCGAG